jgi:outer membrane murein-binding lipoprotein Lpp
VGPGEALAFMTLVLTIGGTIVLRGPLGRALADRIAGRHPVTRGDDPELRDRLEQMATAVDDLRHRLAELEERQDFTERVLAAHREPARLED